MLHRQEFVHDSGPIPFLHVDRVLDGSLALHAVKVTLSALGMDVSLVVTQRGLFRTMDEMAGMQLDRWDGQTTSDTVCVISRPAQGPYMFAECSPCIGSQPGKTCLFLAFGLHPSCPGSRLNSATICLAAISMSS